MTAARGGVRRSVEAWYGALLRGGAERDEATSLFARRHWIHTLADFDERTGEMLPSSLGAVCGRLRAAAAEGAAVGVRDRLRRIVEHAAAPLQEILGRLHEGLVREHATLPIQSVRELDTASFFALSRRPGRTIREKLADRPYLLAVQRRWTVDTAENRLVKTFCARLADLIRTRLEYTKCNEPLLADILALVESWLWSPVAEEIGRWENLPPNNLLLQHRDYRRVWDAWLWMQTLEDDMQRDHDSRLAHFATIVSWAIVARLSSIEGVRLLEQPCHFDAEGFELRCGRQRADAPVHVEGVIAATSAGRSTGVICTIGFDKNMKGCGRVRLPDDRVASFHSSTFSKPEEFARLRIGMPMVFDLVAKAGGQLEAARPMLPGQTQEVRVQLDPGLRVVLQRASEQRVEVSCEDGGDRVVARIGSRRVRVDWSPRGAAEIAEAALSAALGPLPEARAGSAPTTGSAKPVDARVAVVDLCSLRPRFAETDRHGTLPFRLLWQRWDPAEGKPDKAVEGDEIDLGNASAIAVGADVTSVSILDLLAPEPAHPAAVLSHAGKSFASRLREALPADALSYIVPDATDEFTLSTLRRSVNALFREAEPLPRSVAAVFDWQSSAGFAKSALAPGDCVLVLDTVGETISATPLLARSDANLKALVPETRGIYWERLPCVHAGPDGSSTAAATTVLASLGCAYAAPIARLCGLQGLRDEGSEVSWQDESGAWFTAPRDSGKAIQTALQGADQIWEVLLGRLGRELGRLPKGARVHLLLVGDVLRTAGRGLSLPRHFERPVISIDHPAEPALGGMALHRWQERAGDIPLWRDHLPDLRTRLIVDGRYMPIELVKDVTVAPRRGQAVKIPVEAKLELPAGLLDYRFPLFQGTQDDELRYEALLRSPAFPLDKNLPVTLHLTYSYGTDTPYDLVFVPAVAAPGLSPVRAEWQQRMEGADLPSLSPSVPEAATWAQLTRYRGKEPGTTSDLLDWIDSALGRLCDELDEQREVGSVSSVVMFDRLGNRFVFVDCQSGRVFCHENNFIRPEEIAPLRWGDTLSMVVAKGKKGLAGRRIACVTGTNSEEDEQLLAQDARSIADGMKKRLRFPFLSVWANGRSLAEADAPDTFRDIVLKGHETLLHLFRLDVPKNWTAVWQKAVRQLKDEAFLLLCCMHQDAPPEVGRSLRDIIGRRELWYWRHIALALGASKLGWQRRLLDAVIGLLEEESEDRSIVGLRILGIGLWRCPALLSELGRAELVVIAETASRILKAELSRMSGSAKEIDPDVLKDHLELVLALLRTRASEDQDIRDLVAPNAPVAKKLARTVESIIDLVSSHRIPIRSRVELKVEKPESLHGTPDLLYALRLYLTGDAGARAIRVMAVKSDED